MTAKYLIQLQTQQDLALSGKKYVQVRNSRADRRIAGANKTQAPNSGLRVQSKIKTRNGSAATN